jgi:hypothetical protein
MFVLDSTQKITAKLNGAITSDQPEFAASYADQTASALTPGANAGELNSTTDVDIVESPAASTNRLVKTLTFFNKDTVDVEIIVEYDDNGTKRKLCDIAVPSDRTLTYVDGQFTLNELTSSSYIHPNHTGEVTSSGDGATTVENAAISNRTEKTVPTADDVLLIGDAADSDNLKKSKSENLVTAPYYRSENKSGVTIEAGQVGATHGTGTGVILADASDTSAKAVGLVREQTASSTNGYVQTAGLFSLSDWTNVIGAVSLAAKALYFLDTTAGQLVATAPSASGNIVIPVGRAVSLTELDISIGVSVLKS